MMKGLRLKFNVGLGIMAIIAMLFGIYACFQPGGSDCTGKTLKAGDDIKCAIGNRTFYVYAPDGFDPSQPAALVVDAHGAMETAEEHAGIDSEFCANGMCWPGKGSGWRLEADADDGFIVVTPQGRNNVWSNSDESFMLEAVETVKTMAQIDNDRIYMTGISNGAALTYWTGCPNTDVFSGLSPVAGGATCSSIDNPISVITFDAEPDFAYAGSTAASEAMVDLNNCNSSPTVWMTIDENTTDLVCRDGRDNEDPKLIPCTEVANYGEQVEPTVCQQWTNCDNNVKVVFCEVAPSDLHGRANAASDAHILYQNNTRLNLPSLAWRFFQEISEDGSSGSSGGGQTGPCN